MTIHSETEIQDILLKYCRASRLADLGVDFFDKKPLVEKLAGVVEVSDVYIDAEVQNAFVYVIIYVPDIKAGGELTKDRATIRKLERACVEELEHVNGGDYLFDLAGQSCNPHEDGASHFISNRIFIQFNNE